MKMTGWAPVVNMVKVTALVVLVDVVNMKGSFVEANVVKIGRAHV